MEEFKRWLENEKKYGAKSSMDSASRLKRCLHLLNTNEISRESIDRIEEVSEFNILSVSVKSQLRRAMKLYLEFKGL